MGNLGSSLWDLKFYILLALVIILFLVLYVDPSLFIGEVHEYRVKDRCGLGPGNLGMEHTITGATACESQCYGKCEAEDLSLDEAFFEEEGDGACHSCVCLCS